MVHGRVKMANRPPVAHGMGVSEQPGGTGFFILLGCTIFANPKVIAE
jgi:hypothetical protein